MPDATAAVRFEFHPWPGYETSYLPRMPQTLRVPFLLPLLLLAAMAARALAQDDMPVFADVRENGWKDFSWATIGTSTTTVHSGTTALSVTCQGYGALSLGHAPFNPQLYDSISFWINGGSAGGQDLVVQGELNFVPMNKVPIPALQPNQSDAFPSGEYLRSATQVAPV